MVYDVIILGAGASGLFSALHLPKELKKLIVEKQKTPGSKLLLSGNGRCNFTNFGADLPENYFGSDLSEVSQIFDQFSVSDLLQFFDQHGIAYQQEEAGRFLLKSGKSKELLDFLLQKVEENGTELLYQKEVDFVKKDGDFFLVSAGDDVWTAKHVIVALGGKSFPQIGATSFALELARSFGISFVDFYPGLCGIETQLDFSPLSGSSLLAKVELLFQEKMVYQQKGPLLFTHWGVSGPVLFNGSLALGSFLASHFSDLSFSEREELYADFSLRISFEKKDLTKRVFAFLCACSKGKLSLVLETKVKHLRDRKEAKVSGGGILLSELDQYFQSKKVPGLSFIGESVDVTGKTGGFNLQRCWTSARICAKSFS